MFSYIYHLNIVMVHIINNLNYLYINIYYFVCCKTEYYKNIYRTLNRYVNNAYLLCKIVMAYTIQLPQSCGIKH